MRILLWSSLAAAIGPLTLSAANPPPADKLPPPDRPAVPIKDLNFNDGSVRAKCLKCAAATDALAKPGWTVLPFRNLTYKGGPARFVGEWRQNPPKPSDAALARDPLPNHFVLLQGTALKAGPETIDGLELFASFIPKKGWGARSESSPKEVKPDQFNQLNPRQLAAILDEALAEVARRRQLLRDHYQEMFSAAQTAFPLREGVDMERHK